MITDIQKQIVSDYHSQYYLTALASMELHPTWYSWKIIRRNRAWTAWPIWAARWAIAVVTTLGRPAARWKAQWAYIQRFWRWYFAHRECSFFTSQDLGKSPKGRLILAVRRHAMDGPFLLQALDGPIVVPIPKWLSRFRLIKWFSFPNFYSQLQPIALDDLGTDAQAENIMRLLDAGYSVLAFINAEESHPKVSMELAVETRVIPLIRHAPEVFLVNHEGFYEYFTASLARPLFVRIQICPLEDVLPMEGHSDAYIVNRIAQWFKYRTGRVIVREG